MSTPAQITANRLNSLQSTGPVTAPGKAASSANSYKHGLTAAKIAPEHRAAFQAFESQFHEEFQAVTPTEERLVATMLMAAWNMQRCREVQEELWHLLTHGDEPKSMAQAFLDDCKGPGALGKIHRYIRDHHRTFRSAWQEFAASRDGREAGRQAELRRRALAEDQARRKAQHSTVDRIFQDNGFVSSNQPATPPAPAALAPAPAAGPAGNRYVIRGDENPALPR